MGETVDPTSPSSVGSPPVKAQCQDGRVHMLSYPLGPSPAQHPDRSAGLTHTVWFQTGEVEVHITDTFLAEVWLQPTIFVVFV